MELEFSAARAPSRTGETRSTTCPRLVLIVEDDEDISRSVVEVLRDEGFEVHVARDGNQALLALATGLLSCSPFKPSI